MVKFILGATMALVLAACGGGSDEASQVTTPPPVVVSQSSVPPACMPKVVSVGLLGDSTDLGLTLVDGAYVVAPHNPGVELQADMDAEFGAGAVIVTDYGVGGTNATQAPTVKADVIVANYGINDSAIHEPLDIYKAAMLATGATLIETQNPGADDPGDGVAGPYAAAARSLGLPVADTMAYVESLPNWRSMLSDGLHPSDALYVLIIDNVLAPAVAKQVAPLRCR